ncbi:MAG: efflux RND transporter periplasmic adaptor subunit [Vicinamibacterales bacterium]
MSDHASLPSPTAGGAPLSPFQARLWLILPTAIALAVLAWFAWFRAAPPAAAPDVPASAAGEVTLSPAAERSSGIEVQQPRWIERLDRIEASGVVTLNERQTARLGANVEGLVEQMNVQVGDRVRQGTILATIHSHIVHDAWAGYFKALAEKRRAENELRYAQAAEERAARLLTDKALSPQEVDRARSDRIAAEQMLRGARAEETRAIQELAHYNIVAREEGNPLEEDVVPIQAPFSGALIERQVSPGTAVTPGTALFVLSDLSSLWVTAEVEERLSTRIKPGLPVEVQVSAYPGEVFTGTLTMVGDVVNPATRRVTIRCEVANADGRLKPQMFARVTLTSETPRRMLVIPARAVQEMEGQTVVFVRDRDRFLRRPIVVGPAIENMVEVISGADEDDPIAVSGAFLIKSELLKQPEE